MKPNCNCIYHLTFRVALKKSPSKCEKTTRKEGELWTKHTLIHKMRKQKWIIRKKKGEIVVHLCDFVFSWILLSVWFIVKHTNPPSHHFYENNVPIIVLFRAILLLLIRWFSFFSQTISWVSGSVGASWSGFHHKYQYLLSMQRKWEGEEDNTNISPLQKFLQTNLNRSIVALTYSRKKKIAKCKTNGIEEKKIQSRNGQVQENSGVLTFKLKIIGNYDLNLNSV